MSAGVSVARALAGSWRDPPPPAGPDMPAVAEAEEQLMRSGAGGLVWWRIRSDPALVDSPAGRRFYEAFKLNTVYARSHEDVIQRVVPVLRAGGVEALLFKGWDSARSYPMRGMRPYGDIDLCVRPCDLEDAEALLARSPDRPHLDVQVDVGFQYIDRMVTAGWIDGLFDRSHLIDLGTTSVRVLSDEDRVRTLALHALKGGVWIPRSLVDVALAVESRPGDFAWGICLTDDPVVRDWVLTAIALAGKLLGADVDGVPAKAPPRWLVRKTLDVWSAPWPAKHGVELGVLPSVRQPLKLMRALGERWPGPVQATLSNRARFGTSPRLPLQLADALRRTGRFLSR